MSTKPFVSALSNMNYSMLKYELNMSFSGTFSILCTAFPITKEAVLWGKLRMKGKRLWLLSQKDVTSSVFRIFELEGGGLKGQFPIFKRFYKQTFNVCFPLSRPHLENCLFWWMSFATRSYCMVQPVRQIIESEILSWSDTLTRCTGVIWFSFL